MELSNLEKYGFPFVVLSMGTFLGVSSNIYYGRWKFNNIIHSIHQSSASMDEYTDTDALNQVLKNLNIHLKFHPIFLMFCILIGLILLYIMKNFGKNFKLPYFLFFLQTLIWSFYYGFYLGEYSVSFEDTSKELHDWQIFISTTLGIGGIYLLILFGLWMRHNANIKSSNESNNSTPQTNYAKLALAFNLLLLIILFILWYFYFPHRVKDFKGGTGGKRFPEIFLSISCILTLILLFII